MAVSRTTYTWLGLDEWARIMNIDPWRFNGIQHDICSSNCKNFWFQDHENMSREDVALSIRTAETLIANFVNFNLMPDWGIEEVSIRRYACPPIDNKMSIQLGKRHVHSGGVRCVDPIARRAAVTFEDKNGDGFAETGVVKIKTANRNFHQMKVYYPGKEAERSWEIRPVKVLEDRIEIPAYMLLREQFIIDQCDETVCSTDDIYLSEVDVYREYNGKECYSSAFIYDQDCYEDCYNECVIGVEKHCIGIKNSRLGFVYYNNNKCPDRVRVGFYSGWSGESGAFFGKLDPCWKKPIAYLATSLLTEQPCSCGTCDVSSDFSRWSSFLDESDGSKRVFTTIDILENIFGAPTRGANFAYKAARLKKIA